MHVLVLKLVTPNLSYRLSKLFLLIIFLVPIRRSVPQTIPLSEKGQSSVPTYKTVPDHYEEIPAAVKVKSDYAYTQNEAYQTVSGDDNTTPPTEGIYDN